MSRSIIAGFASEAPPLQRAKAIAVLGTASDVGKSTIAAAFCRILADAGRRVAPFKAQNMSSQTVTLTDGARMAWSQALQADAARVVPHPDMNPILLNPLPGMRSEVILSGWPIDIEAAADWMRKVPARFAIVQAAYERLASAYEVIVIEGAGSAAEINLWETDLVNWRTARHADADVVLVADIARGGVFAQLIGTMDLLPPEDRARVKGLIVNQFRGDATLFDHGVAMIEERTGVPVLGVVPTLMDLDLIGAGREDGLNQLAEHVRRYVDMPSLFDKR